MSGLATLPVAEGLSGATARRDVRAQRPLSVAIYMHDLAGGGVERQSLIIAEEFRRSGLNVTLVLHQFRGQLVHDLPPELRVVNLDSHRTLGDITRLAAFLRREQPDFLLSNVDLNNVAALLAKSLAVSSTRAVICQHNPIMGNFAACESWMYRFVGLAYRGLSPLISQAVAVSAGVAAELRQAAGLPAERVITINNPVIGPDFHARSRERLEHPWFADPARKVFVTAGRLVLQKDHATLLRALALHRRHHDSRLILLGSGPLEAELRRLAQELGLQEAVEFAGFIPNALPYLRLADCFVMSSVCEGFGNVLVEAMGCGTPVISTNCEYGPAEILAEGRYGMLVAPRSPDALAAAMNEVGSLRGRFPAEVLRHRAGDFSYAACAARYMAMFKALAPHRAWVG